MSHKIYMSLPLTLSDILTLPSPLENLISLVGIKNDLFVFHLINIINKELIKMAGRPRQKVDTLKKNLTKEEKEI